MAKRFGLGRGLEALLPMRDVEKAEFPQGAGELLLPLERIVPNSAQPRKFFDEEALEELAASVREHGVLQPIIVEETSGDPMAGGIYTIVAGERRYRAAKLAGLTAIPALVREFTDEKRLAVTIIENIQRADLNPIEEAAAYKNLLDITGASQDEAAARLGVKRSTLANALRLLRLPDNIQRSLISAEISAGHARAILSLDNENDRSILFERIVADHLNVRQAEKLAGRIEAGEDISEPLTPPPKTDTAAKEPAAPPPPRDPNLVAIEQKFIEILGTKVKIDGTFDGGTVKIEYFSKDDLDRLYGIFIGD
ncbi:MAG: ParB/RepB/Spo0J family partition protein [Spirochaetaceae bacterium]|jgi:ParB family chromosome partitioning protein|nr:ParB/RepB/Spo0J family partition protein [Spirochaetaceae bacterium]